MKDRGNIRYPYTITLITTVNEINRRSKKLPSGLPGGFVLLPLTGPGKIVGNWLSDCSRMVVEW
jgi:hypothetical protein